MSKIKIILLVVLLSGCTIFASGDIEPAQGILQTQPVYVWGVRKIAVDPMQKGTGVYREHLYVTSYDSKGYIIDFYEFPEKNKTQ